MRRTALLTLILCGALCAPAPAHEGNPNYESLVNAVRGVPGLTAEVLNGDDRLLLVNEGPRTVVVEGYDDEPYARLRADGVVEVNRRSPATYLNDDRFGQVDVPATADPQAPPRWRTVGRGGRFEFHDHRIHWMAGSVPPQVRDDRSERQKVNDWTVPIRAEGSGAGAVTGTLWWQGSGGGAPVAMFVALGVFALLGVALVVVVRRRRAAAPEDDATTAPAREEAW
jgi:hypothetical protein